MRRGCSSLKTEGIGVIMNPDNKYKSIPTYSNDFKGSSSEVMCQRHNIMHLNQTNSVERSRSGQSGGGGRRNYKRNEQASQGERISMPYYEGQQNYSNMKQSKDFVGNNGGPCDNKSRSRRSRSSQQKSAEETVDMSRRTERHSCSKPPLPSNAIKHTCCSNRQQIAGNQNNSTQGKTNSCLISSSKTHSQAQSLIPNQTLKVTNLDTLVIQPGSPTVIEVHSGGRPGVNKSVRNSSDVNETDTDRENWCDCDLANDMGDGIDCCGTPENQTTNSKIAVANRCQKVVLERSPSVKESKELRNECSTNRSSRANSQNASEGLCDKNKKMSSLKSPSLPTRRMSADQQGSKQNSLSWQAQLENQVCDCTPPAQLEDQVCDYTPPPAQLEDQVCDCTPPPAQLEDQVCDCTPPPAQLEDQVCDCTPPPAQLEDQVCDCTPTAQLADCTPPKVVKETKNICSSNRKICSSNRGNKANENANKQVSSSLTSQKQKSNPDTFTSNSAIDATGDEVNHTLTVSNLDTLVIQPGSPTLIQVRQTRTSKDNKESEREQQKNKSRNENKCEGEADQIPDGGAELSKCQEYTNVNECLLNQMKNGCGEKQPKLTKRQSGSKNTKSCSNEQHQEQSAQYPSFQTPVPQYQTPPTVGFSCPDQREQVRMSQQNYKKPSYQMYSNGRPKQNPIPLPPQSQYVAVAQSPIASYQQYQPTSQAEYQYQSQLTAQNQQNSRMCKQYSTEGMIYQQVASIQQPTTQYTSVPQQYQQYMCAPSMVMPKPVQQYEAQYQPDYQIQMQLYDQSVAAQQYQNECGYGNDCQTCDTSTYSDTQGSEDYNVQENFCENTSSATQSNYEASSPGSNFYYQGNQNYGTPNYYDCCAYE